MDEAPKNIALQKIEKEKKKRTGLCQFLQRVNSICTSN